MPETMQDLIAARIDRLDGGAEALLQTASVIGREFSRHLLAGSSSPAREPRRVRDLDASQLIDEKRLLPELRYRFNHALTQDVAYGSLLGQRRRSSIADRGDDRGPYGERLAEHYEVLAHHFSKARSGRRRSTTC